MTVGWWSKVFGHKAPTASPVPPSGERCLCYIKFEVSGAVGIERTSAVVEAFKADKAAGTGRSEDEWAGLFSAHELDAFWRPDEQEQEAWNKYWFSTPLPKRHGPEMPTPPWHFGSMLETILENGDYDLVGVRSLSEREAVLEFDPHGYPYGGTGALRALLRAFGHRIIGVDDGTGYEAGDPQSPRWTRDMQVEA